MAEAVRLASGVVRFRVTETWEPVRSRIGCQVPKCEREATAELYDPSRPTVRYSVCEPCAGDAQRVAGSRLERAVLVGTLTELTMVDTEEEAKRLAGAAAEAWSQGSFRSDQLAPNGRLRAG